MARLDNKRVIVLHTEEDCTCFKKIRLMYNMSFLDALEESGAEYILSCDEDEIRTSLHTFKRGEELKSDPSFENDFVLKENGATWFCGLRGEETEVASIAAWASFREQVESFFRRKYSLLTCVPPKAVLTQEEEQAHKRKIREIFESFSDYDLKEFEILQEGANEDLREDIYCARLKMDISDAGAAKPILCRLLFSSKNNVLSPIECSSAKGLDFALSKGKGRSLSEQGEVRGNISDIIDALAGAVGQLVKNKKSLHRYIVYSTKEDEEAVLEMAERGTQQNAKLNCLRISIIGMYRVQWLIRRYVINAQNTTIFNVEFGMGNSFTLSCASCNEPLIATDKLCYKNENDEVVELGSLSYADGNLQFYDANGYLIKEEEEFKALVKENIFNKHAQRIICPGERFFQGTPCVKYRCTKHLFTHNEERFCIDCSHPEIVYHTKDEMQKDIAYPTEVLRFCHDTLSLSADYKECVCCGRTFSTDYVSKINGMCRFCQSVENDERDANQKATDKLLLKTYRSALPYSYRIKSNIRCAMDSEIILFRIKSREKISYMIFDKSQLQKTDNSYLKLKKVNINGGNNE